MGTALRDDEPPRFNFSVLGGIRDAYEAAFFEDYEAVQEALWDRSLDALHAVRNVIVHRAGVIDEKFVSRVKSIPLLTGQRPEDKLDLNGGLVARLVGPAFSAVVMLIRSVDNWLAGHLGGNQPIAARRTSGLASPRTVMTVCLANLLTYLPV